MSRSNNMPTLDMPKAPTFKGRRPPLLRWAAAGGGRLITVRNRRPGASTQLRRAVASPHPVMPTAKCSAAWPGPQARQRAGSSAAGARFRAPLILYCSRRTEITRQRVTTQAPVPGTLRPASTTDCEALPQCDHSFTRSLSAARQAERCAHNSTTARSAQARTRPPYASTCPTKPPSPVSFSGSPASGSSSSMCTS